MSGDLLVVLPTRRAWALRRFLASFAATAETADLVVVADDDDVETLRVLDGPLPPRVTAEVLPRAPTVVKVNHAAVPGARTHRAVMFLGDDNIPRTAGWDRMITEALGKVPMVFANDLGGREHLLATNIAIRSEIITALGYFDYPGMSHFAVDDVWSTLGSETRCLAYLPDVVIEHAHPLLGRAPDDDLYRETFTKWYDEDLAELARWERDEKASDLDKVRAALTVIGYEPTSGRG